MTDDFRAIDEKQNPSHLIYIPKNSALFGSISLVAPVAQCSRLRPFARRGAAHHALLSGSERGVEMGRLRFEPRETVALTSFARCDSLARIFACPIHLSFEIASLVPRSGTLRSAVMNEG